MFLFGIKKIQSEMCTQPSAHYPQRDGGIYQWLSELMK